MLTITLCCLFVRCPLNLTSIQEVVIFSKIPHQVFGAFDCQACGRKCSVKAFSQAEGTIQMTAEYLYTLSHRRLVSFSDVFVRGMRGSLPKVAPIRDVCFGGKIDILSE